MPDDIYRTITDDESPGFYEKLSDYLSVLGNPTRLRILKITEDNPKDIREIANETGTSYENTKKHINKLLKAGVIRKEAGVGKPTSKGVHAVWKYSTVPGGLELVARNVSSFCNLEIKNPELTGKLSEIRKMIDDEISSGMPVLVLLGGKDDGTVFLIKKDRIKIGRSDPSANDDPGEDCDIVLGDEYRGVTRISKPHATISLENGVWRINDEGSTGGTYVNSKKIMEFVKTSLSDGDMIELGRGKDKASFVFHTQKERKSENIHN
ncbi:putative transcriptional regulator [Methanomicrobium sp. W14]|uniref:FHA domain-containing protein n=1 Tax=Methanomicrobium sp. W14 TaxID=2817839 RepID=UPI001AE1246D|nr:FHA domain-containing protein [Methanomicrobium sp. W14]MBP2133215.1 putative transcriptional regulator [Methanomicrobium sp. W14]